MRIFFVILGWLFFAIGLVGVFLPVLPTTPFMILALWAFARGSRRFHDWLYHHPVFGPSLRKWDQHRVIPPIAKFFAVFFMLGSLIYMLFFSNAPWPATIGSVPVIAWGCWYVLTKPSRIPETTKISEPAPPADP